MGTFQVVISHSIHLFIIWILLAFMQIVLIQCFLGIPTTVTMWSLQETWHSTVALSLPTLIWRKNSHQFCCGWCVAQNGLNGQFWVFLGLAFSWMLPNSALPPSLLQWHMLFLHAMKLKGRGSGSSIPQSQCALCWQLQWWLRSLIVFGFRGNRKLILCNKWHLYVKRELSMSTEAILVR